MMKTILTLFTVIVFCVGVGFGQAKGKEKVYDDATYLALVAKAKTGDGAADFKALRMAFTHTKAYGPFGGSDEAKAAFQAIRQKDYKTAVKKAEEAIKDEFVDMDAHIAASIAYAQLGDTAKGDLHKAIYLGLVNSILTGADGKTPATAFVVITTHEEYVVLQALDMSSAGQALSNADGHMFDVLTATDNQSKKQVKVYFNIDIVTKAESDIFGAH